MPQAAQKMPHPRPNRCKLLRDDADLPPWFLAISTPMESTMESNSRITNQFGALAVDNPARHLPGPQPLSTSLEWGLTTACARPFGLAAQAQRGRSLVLRLRLASGICCTRVIAAGSRGGSAAGGVSAKLALKK